MQAFERVLCSEVSAGHAQFVVVEIPDKRRPAIVQHPYDYTGRLILIARISLVHGANRFIPHHLRFHEEVIEIRGFAITFASPLSLSMKIFEIAEPPGEGAP